MIARLTAALRQQTWSTILLETAQQPEYLSPMQADQRTGIGHTQPTRLNPNNTSSRLNSCLLIDSTAMTHLPRPQNPGECHVYFAEGCHLYIAATGCRGIRSDYGKTNAPDPFPGIQGESGVGRRQGRQDAGRVGAAV